MKKLIHSLIGILLTLVMFPNFAQQKHRGGIVKSEGEEMVSIDLPMADPLATAETKALYANLWLFQQKGVMFGHHDYLTHGINSDGSIWRGDYEDRSDVKFLVGEHPAIYSLDMRLVNESRINLIRAVHRRGGINMLVWHQYNPLTGPPTLKDPNGPGSSWDATKVIDKILVEGSEMNIKYKAVLDQIAGNLLAMKDDEGKLIPVIFRPLHEHTQGWSWWGNKAATEAEYIAFWRFIVHYLRDTKQVHNVIYAISPGMNGIYSDARSQLLYAWPGNNYVDFVGMDCYHGLKTANFISNLKALEMLSAALRKPVGVTEVGLEKDHPADYWTQNILEPLKKVKMSMVVAWRNGGVGHAFGPYPGGTSANDFVSFYQDTHTLFENDLPDMYATPEGEVHEWIFNKGFAPMGWGQSNYEGSSFSASSWDLTTPSSAKSALIQYTNASSSPINTSTFRYVVIRLKNTTPQTTARFYFRYGGTSGRAFIPFDIDASMTGFKDFVIDLAGSVAYTGNGASLVNIGKKWTYDASDPNTQLNMSPIRFDLPSRMSPSQGVGTGSFNMRVSIESIRFLSTLPVDLVEFHARKNGSMVTLSWKTYSEQNNACFEVMRSTDGVSFIKIGEVKGNTNSNKVINYSFNDFNPVQGTNYYHLKQIDFDGSTALSNIVAITASTGNTNSLHVTSVSENYVYIIINSKSNCKGTLLLTDIQGRVLINKKNVTAGPGINTLKIESPRLSSGTYVITVLGADTRLRTKFCVP